MQKCMLHQSQLGRLNYVVPQAVGVCTSRSKRTAEKCPFGINTAAASARSTLQHVSRPRIHCVRRFFYFAHYHRLDLYDILRIIFALNFSHSPSLDVTQTHRLTDQALLPPSRRGTRLHFIARRLQPSLPLSTRIKLCLCTHAARRSQQL